MKAHITTVTRGEIEITADNSRLLRAVIEKGLSAKMVRDAADMAIEQRGDGVSREYVTVTDDDGSQLWAGWMDDEGGEPPDIDVRALYRERAQLAAYLAARHPSVIVTGADPQAPDWPVLFIVTSFGQMSWHLSPDDLDLFGHVEQFRAGDLAVSLWDGHSTEEKYRRLRALTGRTALGRHDDEKTIAGCRDALTAMQAERDGLQAKLDAVATLAGDWEVFRQESRVHGDEAQDATTWARYCDRFTVYSRCAEGLRGILDRDAPAKPPEIAAERAEPPGADTGTPDGAGSQTVTIAAADLTELIAYVGCYVPAHARKAIGPVLARAGRVITLAGMEVARVTSPVVKIRSSE